MFMSFREWASENGYEIKRAIEKAHEEGEDPQVLVRRAYEEEKEAAGVVDKLSAEIDDKEKVEPSPFEKEKARLEGLIEKYGRIGREREELKRLRQRAVEAESSMSVNKEDEDAEADLRELCRVAECVLNRLGMAGATVALKVLVEGARGALGPLGRAARAVLQPRNPDVGR